MEAIVHKLPHPTGRQTYGAFTTADEAKAAGHTIIRRHGIPADCRFAIFQRLGAFVLLSYPV